MDSINDYWINLDKIDLDSYNFHWLNIESIYLCIFLVTFILICESLFEGVNLISFLQFHWSNLYSQLLYDISIIWHLYHMIHYMIWYITSWWIMDLMKKVGYEIISRIMELKKIMAFRRIMDLQRKKWWIFIDNIYYHDELWNWKKRWVVRRIMDLQRKKWWLLRDDICYLHELWNWKK